MTLVVDVVVVEIDDDDDVVVVVVVVVVLVVLTSVLKLTTEEFRLRRPNKNKFRLANNVR